MTTHALTPESGAPTVGGHRRWMVPALAVLLWIAALLVLRHELRTYRYRDLQAAVHAIPAPDVVAALLWTALGFVVLLPAYDMLSLRYAGRPIPMRRTWVASFVAFTLGQNMGFAAVTGAGVRYRFWSSWGLPGSTIARAVAFTAAGFWIGVLAVAGATLVALPTPAVFGGAMPPLALRAIGAALVALVAAYVAWSVSGRALAVRDWRLSPPRPTLALAQITVAVVDWLSAAAAMYVLLPPAHRPAFAVFAQIFVLAQVAGVVSHVPGGLGVFETSVLLLSRSWATTTEMLPALLVFRAVYYLLPLAAALVALAAHEIAHRRDTVAKALRLVGGWAAWGAPRFLSVGTFAAGVVLLVSGATPAIHGRLSLLDAVLPLALIEASHFAGSLAGMALVLLSLGLRRRLDAAFHLSVIALAVGIGASLLKGLDWEEALFLGIVLAALLPARAQFRRTAALTAEPLTPSWIAAVVVVLTGTLWLGFFAYRHVDYSHDLWWRFALRADAPRFLRAMVGATALSVWFGVRHLLAPPRATVRTATPAELERVTAVAARNSTIANLALLGDKALLFDEAGEGFLMYAVRGRSWIALGDPQGTERARRELAWRFREMADVHGGRPVFYEVSADCLPLYIDLGLTLFKLGEEARVPLDTYTLEGSARSRHRQVLRGGQRTGLEFEVVPAAGVREILPEMRRVSDDWLAAKATREKGFSLGRFDDQYLERFPIAVVRKHGRMIAFANLWSAEARREISIDLMRHAGDAPSGVMDYLFVNLFVWAQAQGYGWFNLGMAPLSGMDRRQLAPLWARVGALVYRLGEHFYNFRGLRRYKDKWDPTWEPRYLAAPRGLALPRILLDVASLVSGGVTGIVRA